MSEGFFSRWSARKAATTRQAEAEAEAPPLPEPAPLSDEPQLDPEAAARDEAEIAAKIAALPSIDDITADTDLRPFLQDFVPVALRKAAMRKMWVSDPIISTHLDVARDYAWEFNSGPLPVGFSDHISADSIQRGLDAIWPHKAKAAQEALEATESENTGRPEPEAPTPPQDFPAADGSPETQGMIHFEAQDNSLVISTENDGAIPEPPQTPQKGILQLSRKHGGALAD